MRVLSLLGALALGSALALPAVAEPRPANDLRSQTVRFSDLDLRSASGAAIAVSRISAAARTVCDEYADSTRQIRAHIVSRQCRHVAMDAAVTRLDAPRVSDTYFGRKARVEILASAAPMPAPGK
jgi:UrcA family protein